ncbi:MAG TPA: hypothetical protein VFS52_14430 [Steroidobacteraceae bacterium]|nr:hypothetical protein [Steroidobacteraceae bacterium]
MLAGRGFFTAVSLILIALTCIAFAKRIERERRLLRKLRENNGKVSFADLSDAERDTAEALRAAGVLHADRDRGYIRPDALRAFKQKRIRFVLSGALIALVLAIAVAFILLR